MQKSSADFLTAKTLEHKAQEFESNAEALRKVSRLLTGVNGKVAVQAKPMRRAKPQKTKLSPKEKSKRAITVWTAALEKGPLTTDQLRSVLHSQNVDMRGMGAMIRVGRVKKLSNGKIALGKNGKTPAGVGA